MRWQRRGWGWEGSQRAKRVMQEKARAGDQRHQSLVKRDPRWGGWEKKGEGCRATEGPETAAQ